MVTFASTTTTHTTVSHVTTATHASLGHSLLDGLVVGAALLAFHFSVALIPHLSLGDLGRTLSEGALTAAAAALATAATTAAATTTATAAAATAAAASAFHAGHALVRAWHHVSAFRAALELQFTGHASPAVSAHHTTTAAAAFVPHFALDASPATAPHHATVTTTASTASCVT